MANSRLLQLFNNRDNTQSQRSLAKKFSRWWCDTISRDGEHAEKERSSFHYYTNLSWSRSDLSLLKKQKRPALRLNIIRPFINLVTGIALAQPTNLRVTATGVDNDFTAETFAKIIRHTEFRSKYNTVSALAFRDGIVGGRGWREGFVDKRTNPLGELKYRYVPSSHVKFDTYTQMPDLSDCQHVFRAKWWEESIFYTLFPGQKTRATTKHNPGLFAGWEEDGTFFRSGDASRIMTVDIWWREILPRWIALSLEDTTWQVFKTEAEAKEFTKDRPQYVVARQPTNVLRHAIVTNEKFLFGPVDSPYGNRSYPLFPFFPDLTQGKTDGLVEDLKDVQNLANKVASQTMHMINQSANRSWWFPEGSVDDMQLALTQINKAGGGYEFAGGMVPIEVKSSGPGQELLLIWQRTEDLAQLVTGVQPALQGRAAGSREPFKAAQMRKNQAGNVLGNPMNNWLQSEIARGQWTIDAAQRVLTHPHVLRIVGESDDPMEQLEAISMNQPVEKNGLVEIMNDLSIGMYDIRLDNIAQTLTMKEDALDKLIQMAQAGMPIPPDQLIALMELPSKVKAGLLKGIQEATQAARQSPEESRTPAELI